MAYRVPAFSYPGGKVRLREWLVRRMPVSGGKYVEPFAGRGNVFWLAVHMLDYREWWLNDPWTARWFEAIRRVDVQEIPTKLTEVLARYYRNRAVNCREKDDVAVAIEDITMFGGGVRRGITDHCLRNSSLPRLKRKILQSRSILEAIHPKITNLEWRNCGLENLSGTDFVYLDPPYETTRKDLYCYDTVIHSELLRYLLDAPHLWMLSGCESVLYHRYLGAPEAQRSIRMMMRRKRSCSTILRQECLWTNYTIGADGKVLRKKLKQQKIRKIRRRK